jgi:hypothetical protein
MEIEVLCGEWLATSKACFKGAADDLTDGDVLSSVSQQ